MVRRDRTTAALITLVVLASVLLIGSAPRWAQATITLLVAIAVASQLRSRRTFDRRPPLLILVGVAAAWTFIQFLPMPGGLVEALTPTLDAYRADGVQLAKVEVASTLSMDPAGTLRAAVFLVTLLGLAFVALRVATSERGRYFLVAGVVATAAITAAITGLHELFGASSLYGLYEPRQASPPVMGPLLNSNHLGCLMAIGTVASIGLVLYPKQSSQLRALWAFAGLGCLVLTLTTLSRGAILALCAGMLVTLGTLIAQKLRSNENGGRRRREKLLVRTVPLGVLLVCGLIIAVYVSAGSVMQQFEHTWFDEISAPQSKFAAWRSSLALVEESPWVGVGRGAFEPAFTRVHPASSVVTFAHLENEGLQAVVEWGVPATVVLVALGIWLLLLVVRRWREGALAASVLGALVVVAFQSNFDFGMELLGIAAPVTVLISTLAYVPIDDASARVRRAKLSRGALIALLVGGAAALFLPMTMTLEEDHRTIRTAGETRVRESIARHPLDYLGYAMLAQHSLRAHGPEGVRMLNHALRMHPTHAGLHRVAARLLLRAGRTGQAEIEYAAAIRGLRDPRPVITEVVQTLPAASSARAIPLSLDLDVTVRTLQQEKKGDVALLWLERVHAQKNDLHSAEALYNLAIELGNIALAERAGRARCKIVSTAACRLALARVLASAKKHDEVIELLRAVGDWHGYKEDQIAAWLLLCDAHAARGNVGDARYCIRRLEGSGLVKPGHEEVQRRLDALNVIPKPTN